MKLEQLHEQFNTDKGTHHSYINLYDVLFAPLQHEEFNFLEVGALTCGSLKMFHTYFTQAHIMGVDNWSQQVDHEGHSLAMKGVDLIQIIQDVAKNYPRIQLITCDSTNHTQCMEKLSARSYKVILDDGDHDPHAQFKTFVNLWSMLDKHTGIYVIEDVAHVGLVMQLIQNHMQQLGAQARITPYQFGKNGRSDDNLIVIQPT